MCLIEYMIIKRYISVHKTTDFSNIVLEGEVPKIEKSFDNIFQSIPEGWTTLFSPAIDSSTTVYAFLESLRIVPFHFYL